MRNHALQVSLFSGTLPIALEDRGEGGPTFLLLHGGAGPSSMAGLAEGLAKGARVLAPTHPGFAGTFRPERIARVDDLVLTYLALLDLLDVSDVVLVGNSFGGWLAAEMALRGSRRVAAIALLNAVGIDTGSPARAIVDPMAVPPEGRLALSFHDPARFAARLASPESAKHMPDNQRALRVYAGEPFMHDPTLHARLGQLSIASLVVWGESDRIVDLEYGRRYAASMPGSVFKPVSGAGHFPQIERADEVIQLLTAFARSAPITSSAARSSE
ncbi:alpha/beta fold hydrolase [Sorangium sp. So ce388]|uniref:alpha/beta fold hydrolase n=1 Tax=Sorangium sp. So ce388 TaxID=3133309 RepID=UPI003F5CAB73